MRAAVLTFLLASCAAAPQAVEPDEVSPPAPGSGFTTFDAVPAGVTVYERPTWNVGDRFTLVRGGRAQLQLAVAAIDDRGYVQAAGEQFVMRRNLDLGNLGEWSAADDRALHVLAPHDGRFHWPLWVGKRWSADYAESFANGGQAAMRASSVVEDLDTVTVPAGTFAALRIVRTLQRLDEPTAAVHTQVIWYAPEIGVEVRQILADQAVELQFVEQRK